jgi:hypothetical protein
VQILVQILVLLQELLHNRKDELGLDNLFQTLLFPIELLFDFVYRIHPLHQVHLPLILCCFHEQLFHHNIQMHTMLQFLQVLPLEQELQVWELLVLELRVLA